MRYELYYWPTIQGRGEFVRLALEDAGADYADVARGSKRQGAGIPAMLRLLDGKTVARPPFAPPFLRAGSLIIGQTANILLFLGERHGLAPRAEVGRFWAHQLQLTLADLVSEVHDTHHPIAGSLYYEDQRAEAQRRAADFVTTRLPKFLGYFERLLERNPGRNAYLVGTRLSYPDLSLVPGRGRPAVRISKGYGALRIWSSIFSMMVLAVGWPSSEMVRLVHITSVTSLTGS